MAKKDNDTAPFATLERGLQLRPEGLLPSVPSELSSWAPDTTPLSALAGSRQLPLDCQVSLKRASSLCQSSNTRVATRRWQELFFLHCKEEGICL